MNNRKRVILWISTLILLFLITISLLLVDIFTNPDGSIEPESETETESYIVVELIPNDSQLNTSKNQANDNTQQDDSQVIFDTGNTVSNNATEASGEKATQLYSQIIEKNEQTTPTWLYCAVGAVIIGAVLTLGIYVVSKREHAKVKNENALEAKRFANIYTGKLNTGDKNIMDKKTTALYADDAIQFDLVPQTNIYADNTQKFPVIQEPNYSPDVSMNNYPSSEYPYEYEQPALQLVQSEQPYPAYHITAMPVSKYFDEDGFSEEASAEDFLIHADYLDKSN